MATFRAEQHEKPLADQGKFSIIEERLNSISHGLGAVLSLIGMVVLLVLASLAAHVDPWKIVSLSLYGTTLILLYTASTLYHGIPHPRWKQRFQLLDHCAIYLLMGWMIVLASEEMAANLSSTGIVLLASGGIVYTLGVIFYAVNAIPFNHAIWHLFVIAGSACHYAAIFSTVLPHATNA